MKKLIFLLLLLLIATPCFAQQQEARMSLGVVGGSVPVAAGCVCATSAGDFSGADGDYPATLGSTSDYLLASNRFLADVNAGTICKVEAEIYKLGSPTFNITATIWDDNDVAHLPLGSTWVGNESDAIAASSLGTIKGTFVPISWSTGPTIVNGTYYHLVLRASGYNDWSNRVYWNFSEWGGGETMQAHSTYPTPVWTASSNVILRFKLYKCNP